MNIRLYQHKDRGGIRDISFETALKGDSAKSFFYDKEILADILTMYYTDYENETLLVAEDQDRIIGYLTGCADTGKYLKKMRNLAAVIFFKALIRGVFFHLSTWKIIAASIRMVLNKGFEIGLDLNKYPAHLHINVIKEYRGKKIGKALIDAFFGVLEKRKVRGIHLSVRQDNLNGRAFFEKMGFIELKRYPSLFSDKRSGKRVYTIIYGKQF